MSETKEPFKTYWAYQGYPCEFIEIGVCKLTGLTQVKNKYPPEISLTLHTYLFDTQDEAITYADKAGAFDETMSKEQWCERCDEVIFEIGENELEDYQPIVFKAKEGL